MSSTDASEGSGAARHDHGTSTSSQPNVTRAHSHKRGKQEQEPSLLKVTLTRRPRDREQRGVIDAPASLSVSDIWGMDLVRLVDAARHDRVHGTGPTPSSDGTNIVPDANSATPAAAEGENRNVSVVVDRVHDTGPARDAGLRADDVIVELYNAPFATTRQLHGVMLHAESLVLTVRRDETETETEGDVRLRRGKSGEEGANALMGRRARAMEGGAAKATASATTTTDPPPSKSKGGSRPPQARAQTPLATCTTVATPEDRGGCGAGATISIPPYVIHKKKKKVVGESDLPPTWKLIEGPSSSADAGQQQQQQQHERNVKKTKKRVFVHSETNVSVGNAFLMPLVLRAEREEMGVEMDGDCCGGEGALSSPREDSLEQRREIGHVPRRERLRGIVDRIAEENSEECRLWNAIHHDIKYGDDEGDGSAREGKQPALDAARGGSESRGEPAQVSDGTSTRRTFEVVGQAGRTIPTDRTYAVVVGGAKGRNRRSSNVLRGVVGDPEQQCGRKRPRGDSGVMAAGVQQCSSGHDVGVIDTTMQKPGSGRRQSDSVWSAVEVQHSAPRIIGSSASASATGQPTSRRKVVLAERDCPGSPQSQTKDQLRRGSDAESIIDLSLSHSEDEDDRKGGPARLKPGEVNGTRDASIVSLRATTDKIGSSVRRISSVDAHAGDRSTTKIVDAENRRENDAVGRSEAIPLSTESSCTDVKQGESITKTNLSYVGIATEDGGASSHGRCVIITDDDKGGLDLPGGRPTQLPLCDPPSPVSPIDHGAGGLARAVEPATKGRPHFPPQPPSIRRDATTLQSAQVKVVRSTSSSAGISSLAKIKLKRLWPESSIFIKRILKWQPPRPVKQLDGSIRFSGPVNAASSGDSCGSSGGSSVTIPDTFADAFEMLKAFTPHILNEAIASLNDDYVAIFAEQQYDAPVPPLPPAVDQCAHQWHSQQRHHQGQVGLKSTTGRLIHNSCEQPQQEVPPPPPQQRDQQLLAPAQKGGSGLWCRDVCQMELTSVTPVDAKFVQTHNMPPAKTYEFGFRLPPSYNQKLEQQLTPIVGELFAVYSDSWKATECAMAVIGSHDINSIFLRDQKIDKTEDWSLFKLWICVVKGNAGPHCKEKTGWLAESDMPQTEPDGTVARQRMHIMSIGAVTTFLREYEALKSLASVKPHLQRAVFCQKEKLAPCAMGVGIPSLSGGADVGVGNNKQQISENKVINPQVEKPPCLPLDIWDRLRSNLNHFQLRAIEKVMSGKPKENLLLLQGPPGSGKTTTVLGLVTALLNAPCPQPGGKVTGTRIQIGKSLSSACCHGRADSPVTSRILVCAPSNIAVDNLAWQIHRYCVGPNGKVGDFRLVRYGMLPNEQRSELRRTKGWIRQSAGMSSLSRRDQFLYSVNLDLMAEKSAESSSSGISGTRTSQAFAKYSKERRAILSNCHVVCTTLSSSGSKAFIESVTRDNLHASTLSSGVSSEFDAIIIDEACQASEPSSLIPLKFNPDTCVLVGDPQQLSVLVRSQSAARGKLGRSLFERLEDCGWPVELLRIQYRMHEEIAHFPSKQFYHDQLLTSQCVKERSSPPWYQHSCFPPFVIWNMPAGRMSRSRTGGICNHNEVEFIVGKVLTGFRDAFGRSMNKIEIGIITFYNDQVTLLKNAVKVLSLEKYTNIALQISTVDGFQGSEKDIIILSCVRSTRSIQGRKHGDVGFLRDYKRVNVAMTRARQNLWVVGNCDTLITDPVWKQFIDDAANRNLIPDARSFNHLCSSSKRHFFKRQKPPQRHRRNRRKEVHQAPNGRIAQSRNQP